jgi:hypothetical protein
MDADDLLASIRDVERTPLSRLGSSKALYAITAGEMDDDAVRAAIADVAHHAGDVFAGWDGETAAAAADLAGNVRDTATADHEPDERSPTAEALAALEGQTWQLGGLLAWTLIAGKYLEQVTGYFTGQADPRTASTFRDLGGDVEELREDVLAALSAHDDWEAAEAAARSVIEAAYDAYVAELEAQGVNPKPVC